MLSRREFLKGSLFSVAGLFLGKFAPKETDTEEIVESLGSVVESFSKVSESANDTAESFQELQDNCYNLSSFWFVGANRVSQVSAEKFGSLGNLPPLRPFWQDELRKLDGDTPERFPDIMEPSSKKASLFNFPDSPYRLDATYLGRSKKRMGRIKRFWPLLP